MISFYYMQVLEEVSRKSEWNSWMTQVEALFEMSKDQVQTNEIPTDINSWLIILPLSTVKVDDILCLLESEREARSFTWR
jgi:hypothetical protein